MRSDDAIATFDAPPARGDAPPARGDAPPARGDAPSANTADTLELVSGVTIVVCHSCRRPDDSMDYPRPGSRLHEALSDAAEGTGVAVRKIGCLGNCKRGISAAILRDGSWSYVFGDLTEESAADLLAGATLFAGSTDGFIPFRARPEALKRGLIARIPLIDHVKDAE